MKWSQRKYKTPEFWQATIYIMPFLFCFIAALPFYVIDFFIRKQLYFVAAVIWLPLAISGVCGFLIIFAFFSRKIEEAERQAKIGDHN